MISLPAPKFFSALESETKITETENGAPAYSTTLNACLDMFGTIGGCRNNIEEAQRLFDAAYAENPELALRILFYSRDVRGGMGERNIFRVLFKKLASDPSNEQLASSLAVLVPFYGRWDDLLCLEETPAAQAALQIIRTQLFTDEINMGNGKPVSLLGKWLPSVNASSKETKRRARLIANALGYTERDYRKLCTRLRAAIKIVETQMCQGNWEDIDFQSVPSRAAMLYRKAFGRRQADRYAKYLEDVAAGKSTIKAGTLYPYDLVSRATAEDQTLDLQWSALPDYMPTEGFNGLVVADVSGSMMGQPMDVAVSLAMYIAEHNTSPIWRDKFITFTADPELQEVKGDTLHEKVSNLKSAQWGMNTDLLKVFKCVLDAAMREALPQSELPQKLIIVSDMQFDQATQVRWDEPSIDMTTFQQIKEMYKRAGYVPPHLVFWNVRAAGNVPFTIHESGAHLVSGCSPAVLTAVLNGEVVTAEDVMNEAVGGERYEPVALAYQNAQVTDLDCDWDSAPLF